MRLRRCARRRVQCRNRLHAQCLRLSSQSSSSLRFWGSCRGCGPRRCSRRGRSGRAVRRGPSSVHRRRRRASGGRRRGVPGSWPHAGPPAGRSPCLRRARMRPVLAARPASSGRRRPMRRCRRSLRASRGSPHAPRRGTRTRLAVRNTVGSTCRCAVRSGCRRHGTAGPSSAPFPCRAGSCPHPSCR